jgi:hypothetical protein
MPKPCKKEGCNYPRFGGGYCKAHGYLRTDKQTKKISPRSDKMTSKLEDYYIERKKYLNVHTHCEAIGCKKKATEVHHKLHDRTGKRLTDSRWFMATCRTHHTWIHNNHKEAVELGYLATAEQRHIGYDRGLEGS